MKRTLSRLFNREKPKTPKIKIKSQKIKPKVKEDNPFYLRSGPKSIIVPSRIGGQDRVLLALSEEYATKQKGKSKATTAAKLDKR